MSPVPYENDGAKQMDSLSTHKARAFLKPLDISGVMLPAIAARYEGMRAYLSTKEGQIEAVPEKDAIWFYLQNHAMACVSQRLDEDEPLGEFEPFVKQYHVDMQVKALRMFYYLLIICTRESRHAKQGAGLAKVYDAYPDIKHFHKDYVKDTEATQAIKAMLDNSPDVTLGEYVNFLHDIFEKANYNGGYGGDAWRQVAYPLREFVWGRISAELMLDTAFTLCHNNGPIFNKGMLFKTYNHSEIVKILDVQRSGQIPQLVAEGKDVSPFVDSGMRVYQAKLETLIGAEFGGHVDWFQVKALGAMGTYKSYEQKQVLTHGKPATSSVAEKVAAAKKKAEAIAKQKEQAAFLAKHFEVMSGTYVAKVGRSF